MSFRLEAGVCSDVGSYREVNQDAAFVAPWAAGVADGVGGGPAGDLASAALVHGLLAGGSGLSDAEEFVQRVRMANWDLGAHVRRDPALQGMATTFTALWVSRHGRLLLAHTGDSRAYLLHDGRLTRQTRDDSFVQALVDQGLVREEDAASHPRRNIITASLRGDEHDLVRVEERAPVVGDRWLLCSDGVSDYVPDDALSALLNGVADPREAARLIVGLGLEAGSRDNVTAAVCDIVSGAADGRAVPTLAGAATARFTEVVEEGLATA